MATVQPYKETKMGSSQSLFRGQVSQEQIVLSWDPDVNVLTYQENNDRDVLVEFIEYIRRILI